MAMTLPRLTPEALRTGILEMCASVVEMLRLTRDEFLQPAHATPDRVATLGRELHLREKRLTDHAAMQLREAPWLLGPAEHLAFLPAALERIGDSVEMLLRCVEGIHRDGFLFSEQAFTEVMGLFNRSVDLVDLLAAALRSGTLSDLVRIRATGATLHAFCDEAALHHQERFVHRTCTPRASSVFLVMLDDFREIEHQVRLMSEQLEKTLTGRARMSEGHRAA
jgi:Na+/phosphate symporter